MLELPSCQVVESGSEDSSWGSTRASDWTFSLSADFSLVRLDMLGESEPLGRMCVSTCRSSAMPLHLPPVALPPVQMPFPCESVPSSIALHS